jgi:hypothetical protein
MSLLTSYCNTRSQSVLKSALALYVRQSVLNALALYVCVAVCQDCQGDNSRI